MNEFYSEIQVVFLEKQNMKKYFQNLMALILIIGFPLSAVLAESEIESLKKIEVVYIGYSGFVGHQSHAGEMYSKLTKQRNVEKLKKIIDSSDATIESKIYAVCSLLNISKTLFIRSKAKVLEGGGRVSVLRGDVLRKESTVDLIDGFEKHGCTLDLEL